MIRKTKDGTEYMTGSPELGKVLAEVKTLTKSIDLSVQQEAAIVNWLAPTITLIVKEEKDRLLEDIRKETDTNKGEVERPVRLKVGDEWFVPERNVEEAEKNAYDHARIVAIRELTASWDRHIDENGRGSDAIWDLGDALKAIGYES